MTAQQLILSLPAHELAPLHPVYECEPDESTTCEGCSRIVRQTLFNGGVAYWLCADCFAAVCRDELALGRVMAQPVSAGVLHPAPSLAGEPPTPATSPAGPASCPFDEGSTACTDGARAPMEPAGEGIPW